MELLPVRADIGGTIAEVIITLVIYAIYALYERRKARAAQISPQKLLEQEAEAAAHLNQSMEQQLASFSERKGWSVRGIGPIWRTLLMPRVAAHAGRAQVALSSSDVESAHALHYDRLRLQSLAAELRRLSEVDLPGSESVGFIAVGNSEGLQNEAIELTGAVPDGDLVAAPQELKYDSGPLMAAWAPVLLADLISAALDPDWAAMALSEVRAAGHYANSANAPGLPPPIIRSIAHAVATRSNPPSSEGEVVLVGSTGHRYAIPSELVHEDARELIDQLMRHRFATLGGRTIADLQGMKNPARRRAPAPTSKPAPAVRSAAPTPRAARAAKPAPAPKAARTAPAPKAARTAPAPKAARTAPAPKPARAARSAETPSQSNARVPKPQAARQAGVPRPTPEVRHAPRVARAARAATPPVRRRIAVSKPTRKKRRPSRHELREAVVLSDVLPL